MQAIILKHFGGIDQLEYAQLPLPVLKPGEVLVKVHAFSINPVDAKTRKGKGQAERLRNDPPMILGWDISGVIADSGDSGEYEVGDAVFGMINIPGHGKAYAEYVAARTDHITRKPAAISHAAAAGACLAAMTAYQAIVDQAKLRPRQRILIHAASGGVGHFAVQIAKTMNSYVIGTSSLPNRDFVLSLGADEHIDYNAAPLEKQTSEVDVVIDAIGGDNIQSSLRVLKKGGTIVSLPSGISESVGQQAAAQDKHGIFFFVKSNASDMQKIAELMQAHLLTTHISEMFDFKDIARAHEQIESGRTIGKIVVILQ